MKVVAYMSDKPREHMLANAFKLGIQQAGHEFELRRMAEYGENIDGNDLRYPGPSPDTDVAMFFGVKGKSRQVLDDHLAMGKQTIMLDKGYSRSKGENGHTEYSRVIVNALDPSDYMMNGEVKGDRWKTLGIRMGKQRKIRDGHILFCGSTQKYHDFHGIGDMTEYAARIFGKLRKVTAKHFVYRPKPSAKRMPSIPGTFLSSGGTPMSEALRGCHIVVTHGSTAAMDAVMSGVPALVLGKSIASPVSESDLLKIDDPFFPTDDQRYAWACQMAYCQWTNEEMRNGAAWEYCMSILKKVRAK